MTATRRAIVPSARMTASTDHPHPTRALPMPATFTCPRCRQTNYGVPNPPTGDSFMPQVQCTRCGLKDIYWTASQQTAVYLVERHVPCVPRDQIAVGVG